VASHRQGGAEGPAPPAVPNATTTCGDLLGQRVPVTIVRLLEDGLAVVDTGSSEEESASPSVGRAG